MLLVLLIKLCNILGGLVDGLCIDYQISESLLFKSGNYVYLMPCTSTAASCKGLQPALAHEE